MTFQTRNRFSPFKRRYYVNNSRKTVVFLHHKTHLQRISFLSPLTPNLFPLSPSPLTSQKTFFHPKYLAIPK